MGEAQAATAQVKEEVQRFEAAAAVTAAEADQAMQAAAFAQRAAMAIRCEAEWAKQAAEVSLLAMQVSVAEGVGEQNAAYIGSTS